MARRNKNFNALVSEKMKDPEFAKQTFITSIDEFGESIEEALKYTIQQMGIKEFSDQSGICVQNISDFIKGKRNLKLETLDRYLAVFNLKSKIVVISNHAA